MKKTLLLLSCWLLLFYGAFGQCKFNWRSATQQHPANTAAHIYTNAYGTVSVDIAAITGGTQLAWQSGEPRVPSGTPDRFSLGVNFSGTTANPATSAQAYTTVSITFSTPVCGLSYSLYEIDRGTLNAVTGKYSYVDEVVVSALNSSGGSIAMPTITPSAYVTVVGNTITGSASDGSNSPTTITYPASDCVKTLTIQYQTGANNQSDPISSLVSIGCMNWATPSPVTMASLSGTQKQNDIVINWATSAESNSESFDVQRSTNLQSFENIGQIKAAGNSTDKKNYSFIDKTPLDGLSYYRLKQNDFDGSYAHSRVIPITYTMGDLYYHFKQILTDEITIETNASNPSFELYLLSGFNVIKNIESLDKRTYKIKLQNQSNQNLMIFRMKTEGRVLGEKFFVNQ
jgi:hypothetical protein